MDTDFIVRKDLPPAQRKVVDEKVRAGKLQAILPGIYCPREEHTWLDRVHAALLARPEGWLHGATAARLTFWPELANEEVHLAEARFRNPPTWLKPSQMEIPKSQRTRRGDLRLVTPALATLELSTSMDASAIDEALRRRAVTIEHLNQALKDWPWRPRNKLRARLLWESSESPWSALEREGHAKLREARIKGWRGNHRVRIGANTYYIDIAFPGRRIAVELDGWAYHGDRDAMERDITRHNMLQSAGWQVYRFGWHNLDEMVPTLKGLGVASLQQRASR